MINKTVGNACKQVFLTVSFFGELCFLVEKGGGEISDEYRSFKGKQ